VTAAAPSVRERRANLFAILTACVSYGLGMGLTLPLLALILERKGVPGAINGLNLATGGLAALVLTPFTPRMIARFGAAHYLAACLAIAAAALIAIYEAPSLWFWFPIRFVLSSGLNGLFVASEFWVNRLADEKNRGRYVALYAICLSGGFGIGPTLLKIIGTHGIAPFAAGSGLLLLALVPVLSMRKSAPRIEESGTSSLFAVIRAAPAALTASFVFGAIDAGMTGLLPVYAVRSGYTESNAALTVTAIALGSIALQYPLGYLADRLNRRLLLALCTATGIVGSALAPFAVHTPPLMYALLFVWGGLILGIYSIGLTLIGERFKGIELPTANAAFVLLYSLGLLLGPSAEGVALDLWNPNGLLVVLGAICAGYVMFLMLPRSETAVTSRRGK
jgi:MFS family permease